MPRTTTIPAREAAEEIQSYEHRIGLMVRVFVGTGTAQEDGFRFDDPQTLDVLEVIADDYTALMADQPVWAPTKAAGTFLTEHLWRFVDSIREQRALMQAARRAVLP